MRVAVDARALEGPRSGLRVYTESMLAALAAAAPEIGWTLVSTAPIAQSILSAHNLVLGGSPSTALRPWWVRGKLRSALLANPPDLWFSPLSAVPARVRCKTVAVVHDLAMFHYPEIMPLHYRWSWKSTLRSAVRHADAIIAVSQSTRRDLVELLRAPEEKITVVYEAADESYFTPPWQDEMLKRLQAIGKRESVRLKPGYLLYPATIEPRKNHAFLLSLYVVMFLAGRVHAPLVLVGGRGWGNNSRALAILREPPPGCPLLWIPSADQEDLRALYAGAALCAFPSLYEGFGLPAVEAMAAGVPMIASNVSSLPEVVGDAGILLPPKDAHAWMDAIVAMLGDDARRAAMIQRGRRQARGFSWERAAAETLELWDRLLA